MECGEEEYALWSVLGRCGGDEHAKRGDAGESGELRVLRDRLGALQPAPAVQACASEEHSLAGSFFDEEDMSAWAGAQTASDVSCADAMALSAARGVARANMGACMTQLLPRAARKELVAEDTFTGCRCGDDAACESDVLADFAATVFTYGQRMQQDERLVPYLVRDLMLLAAAQVKRLREHY